MFNVGDTVTVTKIVPEEHDYQLHEITSKCFGHILTVIMPRDNDTDFLVSDDGNMYYIPSELLKKVEEDLKEEKTEKKIQVERLFKFLHHYLHLMVLLFMLCVMMVLYGLNV